MIEQLRYVRRVGTRDTNDETWATRWRPWPVEPPRALIGALIFDAPMAASALAAIWAASEPLRARTLFDVWAVDSHEHGTAGFSPAFHPS
jgi:hypothetical protein